MRKSVLMSAAKKARIALAVMAVFGMTFVGASDVFAAGEKYANVNEGNNNTVYGKNNIVAVGAGNETGTSGNAEGINIVAMGVGNVASASNTISVALQIRLRIALV